MMTVRDQILWIHQSLILGGHQILYLILVSNTTIKELVIITNCSLSSVYLTRQCQTFDLIMRFLRKCYYNQKIQALSLKVKKFSHIYGNHKKKLGAKTMTMKTTASTEKHTIILNGFILSVTTLPLMVSVSHPRSRNRKDKLHLQIQMVAIQTLF